MFVLSRTQKADLDWKFRFTGLKSLIGFEDREAVEEYDCVANWFNIWSLPF